jgi:glyoxylase-like metal-dependent hydrolase (beta-lactamase superfamily II)
MKPLFPCLVGVMLAAGEAHAQGSSPTVQAILAARQVLNAAVDAMGGRAAVGGVRTYAAEEVIRRTAREQGLTPGTPSVTAGYRTFALDNARRRIAELRLLDITGNQLWDYQSIVTPDTSVFIYWPNLTITGSRRAAWLGDRAALTRHQLLPLLQAMDQRFAAVRPLPPATLDGRANDVLTYADVDGVTLSLFVDRETHLPSRIEQFTIDPATGDSVVATTFADYRREGALNLPHRIVEIRPPGSRTEYLVQRIAVNEPIDDKAFAFPATLVPPAPPPAASAGVVELAKDVYLVPNQYESVFVVFDDYVLVLEGGGSNGQTANTIDRIRATAPGKPIRYVVATHFHNDHIGGLRNFIAQGATIVTTRDAVGPIKALAHAPASRIFPDSLSRAPTGPVIETVDKDRVFRDAHHEVRIYQVGPSPHVAQILIGYLPAERILFEGDLLDIPDGQPVAGGDDTRDFAAKVKALGLAFDRIVPVHGMPGPASLLELSLKRSVARERCGTGDQRREVCRLE